VVELVAELVAELIAEVVATPVLVHCVFVSLLSLSAYKTTTYAQRHVGPSGATLVIELVAELVAELVLPLVATPVI
jgi:hypothetical protein